MTVIERPLLGKIYVQTFDVLQSPFVLGLSKVDYSPLGGGTGTTALWTDWTPTVRTVSIQRGCRRDGVALPPEIGAATITLTDPGDALDPATGIHPNMAARIILRLPGKPDLPLFTGRVHDLRRDLINGVPVLTLVLADAVREISNITRYGALGIDTFAERVARLAASTNEPIEIPTTSPTTLLTRTVYESSLANHFTMTCNTMGAMWWVGADGVTRFALRKMVYGPGNVPTGGSFFGDWEGHGRHQIRSQVGTGLDGFFNKFIANEHRAMQDEYGRWVADDVSLTVMYAESSWGRWGERSVAFESNHRYDPARPDDRADCINRLRGGPDYDPRPAVRTLTWNAQEDLTLVDGLEIGNGLFVRDPAIPGGDQRYLIIAIRHTITPTRWLIDLDLIGAT